MGGGGGVGDGRGGDCRLNACGREGAGGARNQMSVSRPIGIGHDRASAASGASLLRVFRPLEIACGVAAWPHQQRICRL